MANPQQFLSFFIHNPLGEEILEGTAGGLLAGAGTAAGGDTTFADALVKTGSAVAGGIGFGIAGRRLGARIGRKIQPKALKDQDSMVASLARMGGSETTVEGMKSQGNMLKATVEKGLVDESVYGLVKEAKANPIEFQKRYNINPESMLKHANNVKYGNTGLSFLNMYKDLDPKQRKVLTDQVLQQAGIEEFGQVENVVRKNAANSIDNIINAAKSGELDNDLTKELLKKSGSKGGSISSLVTDMMSPRKPVTGEEVGRFVGRVAGDEIGVLGGLGVGSMISSSLGIDSPKDKTIKELEKKLLYR
tara:strand:+ start:575 stop:1489 length:915 start_codon:yes stop_codon:yes gene_type:complete